MRKRKIPDSKVLHECFAYDPESPSFLRWKKRPREHFNTLRGMNTFNGTWPGKPAGSLSPEQNRYWLVGIKKRLFFVHRIIFSMFNTLPDGYEVDHIDGNTFNNSIENLRSATRLQNTKNSKKAKNTASGVKGVTRTSNGRYWCARITCNKVVYNIGCYETIEEASKAYEEKAKLFFGKFNRE